MRTKLLTLALFLSGAAIGADKEFDQIVKAIESHYGTKPTHVPFMGVANFVLRTAHPEGVAGFKIAVFEDLAMSSEDEAGVNQFMNGLFVGELHPIVQVQSRSNGESTYIYAGAPGKYTRLLLATFGSQQATVVEVKVNIETLVKALQNPEGMRDFLGVNKREE